jgi:hypothetical protein
MNQSINQSKESIPMLSALSGAGIAQSVLRLATRWTTERSEFEPRLGRDFSPLNDIQTGMPPWTIPFMHDFSRSKKHIKFFMVPITKMYFQSSSRV